MVFTSTRPAMWKESKNKRRLPALLSLKFHWTPAPLVHTLKLADDSPFCMAQVLFKLLPLWWTLEWMSFCMSPLRVESLPFPTASGLPQMWALLVFRVSCFGRSASQCRFPRLGRLIWDLDPCSSGDTSEVVISLLFVGCLTGVWGRLVLTRPGLCASYLSQWGLFLIPLGVENLSC